MTLVLGRREDINLQAVYRVAWQGETVSLAATALAAIAASRERFLKLLDTDPDVVIYGVTTAMGEHAAYRLSPAERDRHARIKPYPAAAAFGDPLPDRVVRAILLARLGNFLEGHAATTPRIALAVAAMLDGRPLPQVACSGQCGPGEILALYPLFAELAGGLDLEVKERGSLINGSPCAAALVADAALAARRRWRLAAQVFALSVEAMRAPLEHYDAALDGLWGDEHEAAALQALRALLAGAGGGRRNYQAPVSFRILPRVLGAAHRALAGAERAAQISLRSVSDNPVYLPPDADHPLGRCISTGGYHNAMAAPALDDLAGAWADLCLLGDRHAAKLLDGPVSQLPDLLVVGREPGTSDGHGHIGYVPMVISGYVEQARAAAQRSFIPGNDFGGQDDVGVPAFMAWDKERRAGLCLDASLAMLAAVASQALYATDREAPAELAPLLHWVRGFVPPLTVDRVLGPELQRLCAAITAQIFSGTDS
jgi:histidine ammonia-lyase